MTECSRRSAPDSAHVFAVGRRKWSVLLWQAVWVLGTAGCMVLGLFLFFKYTNSGPGDAGLRGQPPRGHESAALNRAASCWPPMPLAPASARSGGIVIAPMTMTGYDVGIMLGLKGFCAAIVGGLSSLPGAVAGGLLLGVLEAMSAGPFAVIHFPFQRDLGLSGTDWHSVSQTGGPFREARLHETTRSGCCRRSSTDCRLPWPSQQVIS